MNTNGLMFCDEWTDNINIFYHVSFSLNASNEARYNKIIAKSDFNKVVSNIDKFCKKANGCESPIDIRATMVVTADTVFDIYDFVNLYMSLVYIMFFLFLSMATDSLVLSMPLARNKKQLY